jgi:hypothetical protein
MTMVMTIIPLLIYFVIFFRLGRWSRSLKTYHNELIEIDKLQRERDSHLDRLNDGNVSIYEQLNEISMEVRGVELGDIYGVREVTDSNYIT